jgi:N-acetylglucosaminyl-diphospho-decaprenol L-rhamnosyltransferase
LPKVAEPAVPQVGAVVVAYDAGDHLLACVDSLSGQVDEVVVVDNASTDGSVQSLARQRPGTRLVALGANLGYGAAANWGVAETASPLVLVCNPDVVVSNGAVRRLADQMGADPGLGVVGPRILNPDGSTYPSARRFPSLLEAAGHGFLGLLSPSNPFSRRYRMLDWERLCYREVDWVSGACLMARRRAWDQVGGFDPRYFMYLEDVDLCWRLRQRGWRVAYQPEAEVVHHQGASARARPYRMVLAHHLSMARFAAATARGPRRLLLPAVEAGVALRATLALARVALSRGSVPRPGSDAATRVREGARPAM